MSLTFLLPCSWLTHFVELSYWTVFSWLEPTSRTVSVDLSVLTLVTIPSQRAGFAAFAFFAVSMFFAHRSFYGMRIETHKDASAPSAARAA